MDKYSGCNKVESVSYTPQKPKPEKASVKRGYRSFFARLAVACVLTAGVCAAAYLPTLAPYRETVKNILCYDMFGHDDVGTSLISSWLN